MDSGKFIGAAVLLFAAISVAHAGCFAVAARTQGVSENLLRAIAKVESNYNPEALNPASHALGVMQILPSNFKSLQKYDITEPDLHQACTNINVGAWILAGFIRQYGPVWRAVGAYGVGNGKSRKVEAQRGIYAAKVYAALAAVQRQGHKPMDIDKTSRRPVMMVLE